MRHAIEKSCNVYFYTLGNMLGVDRIHKWAVNLGLHGKSGIDLPNEQDSLVPSTRVEEAAHRRALVSGRNDLGGDRPGPERGHADGPGRDDGDARQRRHARGPASGQGGGRGRGLAATCRRRPTRSSRSRSSRPRSQAIHDGLWLAVNGAGTAGRARIAGRDVAGKTGTAQVISLQGRERARGTDKDLRDHGWFVFMVPRDNPELAGVVFAEHSEHGYLAAPIAKHVIETYYAEKEGRPLPTLTPSTPGGARCRPRRGRSDRGGGDAAAAADGQCRPGASRRPER